MTGMRGEANVATGAEIGVGQPQVRNASCHQGLAEARTGFPLEPPEKAQPGFGSPPHRTVGEYVSI